MTRRFSDKIKLRCGSAILSVIVYRAMFLAMGIEITRGTDVVFAVFGVSCGILLTGDDNT